MKKNSATMKKNRKVSKPLSKAKSPRKPAMMARKYKGNDIVELCLRDHKPLKTLIETLKNPDVSHAKKKPAFERFSGLLTLHSKSEEESLYVEMKKNKSLRVESHEGDAEHGIADQLVQELKIMVGNEDKWMARVKVLAELVENHIKDEEKKIFKDVNREFEIEERVRIGADYSRLHNLHKSEQSKQKVPNEKTSRDVPDEKSNQGTVWATNEKLEKHKNFYR